MQQVGASATAALASVTEIVSDTDTLPLMQQSTAAAITALQKFQTAITPAPPAPAAI
jgi:hypothetical protein